MKKNVMMRMASLLLVAVLISTSAISGTYAKYVTTASGSDTARVAHFGVVATVTGSAFQTQYETTDTTYTNTAYTVVSNNGENLVAPGTNGTFGGVALTGTPEVAVRVSYEGSEVEIEGWELASGFYCPLTFNINGTPVNGLDYFSADQLEDALMEAIVKGAGDYAPNTDLSAIDNLNGEYTWAWAFEGAEGSQQTDGKDTELGNQAARGTRNTISFAVTCTVTQID